MKNIKGIISKHKLVPVIKINAAQNASLLADALYYGGLPVAEVTFRTEAAEEAISIIAKQRPEILIGAGTITNVDQTERAINAGAEFIVTAGFNRKVTEYCVKKQLPIFPGACTPTELMFLLEYGLDIAKFFPAAQFGGLDTIKALAAPFPQMKFMPTGGVSEKNILDYLSFSQIIACGGSWMVKETLIDNRQYDEIVSLVKQAVKVINEGER